MSDEDKPRKIVYDLFDAWKFFQSTWNGYTNEKTIGYWNTILVYNFIILPACGFFLWTIFLFF